ncbi:MAG: Ribosomal RNA small subunit methyltransferase H [Parcubacteria group bacterium GW2011_GWA2_43_17]|nr:MAG: Ribosomal RNA small subunit methyltransferase H [Parcubacteria group bacterium GW2011_GWA2_43_17]KKT93056.1 MAG: Ribosomal RNA small subunit methyltransferase H [Parcubacteria group bacterium GW2011_GWF2_45_11]OGY96098.1 MAG: 16S rRNA (cytosine(1402)-N(4))-methyltransferase [Candidatus Komeilibacteria bacterium RIFOXYC2_FULL_45_12]HAH04765.1 16S rRNA (cytosine(1402)-N(4))-methyltransferase [Candidatus Komeilibacteria bacterium]HBR13314.1 16S rRNA (cytosine(1402)-N(4))-methyltransferase 
MAYHHQPVLVNEVLEYLNLKPNDNVIDCTLGGGGHAENILERTGPHGHLLALDRDPRALEAAGLRLKKFSKRVTLIQNSYKNLPLLLADPPESGLNKNKNYKKRFDLGFAGLLLDLGLSSAQVSAEDGRGFSFQSTEALDMRFGPDTALTAAEIVNQWSKEDLIKIFKEYGEEKFAKSIAENIILFRARKLLTATSDLVKIIEDSYPTSGRGHGQGRKIHPATKVFQALRIAVNDELRVLAGFLPQALEALAPGGRLVVISYHSLEDRIVKHFFNQEAKDCLCPKEIPVCVCGHQARLKILTKKPVTPSTEEISKNSRSRSAKLRAAEKV